MSHSLPHNAGATGADAPPAGGNEETNSSSQHSEDEQEEEEDLLLAPPRGRHSHAAAQAIWSNLSL